MIFVICVKDGGIVGALFVFHKKATAESLTLVVTPN
jgi:hypothetical protein